MGGHSEGTLCILTARIAREGCIMRGFENLFGAKWYGKASMLGNS